MTILRTNTIAGIGSDGAGTVLGGSFSFTSQNYVILPKGTTDNRVGLGSTPGALRYNTDSSKVELYDGSQWAEVQSSRPDLNGGARGVFGGGGAPAAVNTIDYITISSTGNAIDFGDLLFTSFINGSYASSTRGLWAGSRPSTNTINYVTISSTGNAQDFGDLTDPREGAGGMGNSTRGIFSGGGDQPSPGSFENVMDYVTIAQTGNAVDFGDLTQARLFPGACSSSTRGVLIGGYISPGAGGDASRSNVIDFVTISTLGNAQDFGDMTAKGQTPTGTSNATRGVFNISQNDSGFPTTLNYITIATTGNAVVFGDMTVGKYAAAGCASSTRGVMAGSYSPGIINVIDYITIMTQGNAVDFGDLTQARGHLSGCSNAHGGL